MFTKSLLFAPFLLASAIASPIANAQDTSTSLEKRVDATFGYNYWNGLGGCNGPPADGYESSCSTSGCYTYMTPGVSFMFVQIPGSNYSTYHSSSLSSAFRNYGIAFAISLRYMQFPEWKDCEVTWMRT